MEGSMLEAIQKALWAIEQEYNAGSRAWGLSSVDSDYDVKFVYVHTPGWYAQIDEGQRDVIDKSVDSGLLDLNGWDLRKAVKMLRESNCFIFEWLASDIKYKEHSGFVSDALALGMSTISWKAIAFHYLNKAKKHMREYFEGDRWKEEVILKKYFFVLQPLFSVEFLRIKKELPPRLINDLVDMIDLPNDVKLEVLRLIELKKKGELQNGHPILVLDTWIAESLIRCEKFAAKELPEKYVMEPYVLRDLK